MSPQPRLQVIGDGPRPRRGVTPPSGSGGERFLADVIVELGLAERDAVDRASESARTPGKSLGWHLVEAGEVTEDELARAVAERYGLDHVDLTQFEVDPRATSLVPRSLAARHRAVPIAFDGDEEATVVVAMADPGDWLATDEIAATAGLDIRPAVAASDDIVALLERVAEDGGGVAPAGAEGRSARRDDAAEKVPAGGQAASPPPPSPPASRSGGGLLEGELDILRQELASAYARIEARDEELSATRRELTAAQRDLADARLDLAGTRKGSAAG